MTLKSRVLTSKSYHHGELRTAVLGAAEQLLEQHGPQALTLRAVARAVGVSHTAPKNHFGDLTGLLSELAAVGFQRFGSAMTSAMEQAGSEPRDRMKAMGQAYVGFARSHPKLFQLMFRSDRLDITRPSLQDAISATREALRSAAAARTPGKKPTPREIAAQAVAMWSLVHGFAMLLLDGRLKNTIASLNDDDGNSLLESVLAATRFGD